MGGRDRDRWRTGEERQRRKEAMSERECSGDDNTAMMRGAGGETHSVVVLPADRANEGPRPAEGGEIGNNMTEMQ